MTDPRRRVGRNADLTSDLRDSLLTLGRIIPYVAKPLDEWLPSDASTRINTLQQDIGSLKDYETHLANKSQLLLDATLGLINIEQNNIIKVLTVVSIVGIPPTLIASIYGMNFNICLSLNGRGGILLRLLSFCSVRCSRCSGFIAGLVLSHPQPQCVASRSPGREPDGRLRMRPSKPAPACTQKSAP